jgi:hypothetical protein
VSAPARAAALAALLLAAGCSVRADLGGTDGGPRDAKAGAEAPDDVAAEAAVDVGAEAPVEAAPEAPIETAPEVVPEVAPEAPGTEPDAAAVPADAGAPASCDDNLLDGDETDIDCGGSCAPCGLAQHCNSTSDCGTWPGCDPLLGCACDAVTKTCVYNHCSDYRQDFGETAVDCGGGECPGCGPQKACILDSDCSRTLPGCSPNGDGCTCDLVTSTCVYDHCFDHKNDAEETGVDCGGGCGGCALGVGCEYTQDCLSQACDGLSFTCVSNQCADHRQDGSETDIDCGGSVCSPCAIGMKCSFNSDCQTGICAGYLIHVCE